MMKRLNLRQKNGKNAKKCVIDRLTEIINGIKPPEVITGPNTNEGVEESCVNDIETAKGIIKELSISENEGKSSVNNGKLVKYVKGMNLNEKENKSLTETKNSTAEITLYINATPYHECATKLVKFKKDCKVKNWKVTLTAVFSSFYKI